MKERLTYKNDKGDVLYGFSQRSLDRNTFWTRMLVIIFTTWTVIVIWLIWKILVTGAVNTYIAQCV